MIGRERFQMMEHQQPILMFILAASSHQEHAVWREIDGDDVCPSVGDFPD